MRKLKKSVFISVTLGIISFLALLMDFFLLMKISTGEGTFELEFTLIKYSFYFFILFFLSFFITAYQTIYFLNKKVSRTYP